MRTLKEARAQRALLRRRSSAAAAAAMGAGRADAPATAPLQADEIGSAGYRPGERENRVAPNAGFSYKTLGELFSWAYFVWAYFVWASSADAQACALRGAQPAGGPVELAGAGGDPALHH